VIDARVRALIVAVAEAHGLAHSIVEAVVRTESSGNPWAWNPEPRYRYFWDVKANRPFRKVTMLEIANQFPPADFPALAGDRDQEWWAQQASFGLTQVMGAVARELGFRGPYLTELCQPEVNLEYGCRKLRGDLRWAHGDVRVMLAAYNGGRDGNAPGAPLRSAAYADKVLSRVTAV
jgi:hypothetical protein